MSAAIGRTDHIFWCKRLMMQSQGLDISCFSSRFHNTIAVFSKCFLLVHLESRQSDVDGKYLFKDLVHKNVLFVIEAATNELQTIHRATERIGTASNCSIVCAFRQCVTDASYKDVWLDVSVDGGMNDGKCEKAGEISSWRLKCCIETMPKASNGWLFDVGRGLSGGILY